MVKIHYLYFSKKIIVFEKKKDKNIIHKNNQLFFKYSNNNEIALFSKGNFKTAYKHIFKRTIKSNKKKKLFSKIVYCFRSFRILNSFKFFFF